MLAQLAFQFITVYQDLFHNFKLQQRSWFVTTLHKTNCNLVTGSGKANSVFAHVKFCVVSTDENIAKDP